MIVSFPEDAALIICCSIDRVCLAVRTYDESESERQSETQTGGSARTFRAAATFAKAGFFGGSARFPFFGCDALSDFLDGAVLLCNPLVLP